MEVTVEHCKVHETTKFLGDCRYMTELRSVSVETYSKMGDHNVVTYHSETVD